MNFFLSFLVGPFSFCIQPADVPFFFPFHTKTESLSCVTNDRRAFFFQVLMENVGYLSSRGKKHVSVFLLTGSPLWICSSANFP